MPFGKYAEKSVEQIALQIDLFPLNLVFDVRTRLNI